MILQLLFLLISGTNLGSSDNIHDTSFSCLMAKNASISYQNNVKTVFYDFTNHASLTGFYTTQAGDSPNKVYGYYMCRGDTTSQVCNNCILNTTRFAQEANCNYEDGLSYSEMCVFRYSNHSMYGVWQEGLIVDIVPIGQEESKTRQYNRTLSYTIDALIDKAAYGSCNKSDDGCVPGFATLQANITGENQTIYCLGQCTPDIVGANCSKCLRIAFVGLGSYMRYQGAKIYKPNCQLMYDNTSFYDLEKVTPSKGGGSRSLANKVHLYFAKSMLVFTFLIVV